MSAKTVEPPKVFDAAAVTRIVAPAETVHDVIVVPFDLPDMASTSQAVAVVVIGGAVIVLCVAAVAATCKVPWIGVVLSTPAAEYRPIAHWRLALSVQLSVAPAVRPFCPTMPYKKRFGNGADVVFRSSCVSPAGAAVWTSVLFWENCTRTTSPFWQAAGTTTDGAVLVPLLFAPALKVTAIAYAAIGAMLSPRALRVKVLPEAHACEDARAAENRNVPAEDADHTETWVSVSLVPPLVHADGAADAARACAAGAAKVRDWRAVEPTDTEVVPAAPGSAVCSWMNTGP